MATRMLQRRGTAAEWAAANPILASGEIGFETDTKILKMGDGVNAWNDLIAGYVQTGGGTMTGALSLIAPTAPAHAARKQDVDNAVSVAQVATKTHVEAGSSFSITSTETAYFTVQFTPPVGWGTYKLAALGATVHLATGSTVARSRIRIDGNAGTTAQKGASESLKHMPVAHDLSGLSGVIDVELTAWNSSASGTIENGNLLIIAHRES